MAAQATIATSILTPSADYLHFLGWKSFQALAVAIAEERLIMRRPVHTFLPRRDAGRDGAFVGRWGGPIKQPASPLWSVAQGRRQRRLGLVGHVTRQRLIDQELGRSHVPRARRLAWHVPRTRTDGTSGRLASGPTMRLPSLMGRAWLSRYRGRPHAWQSRFHRLPFSSSNIPLTLHFFASCVTFAGLHLLPFYQFQSCRCRLYLMRSDAT